MPEFRWTFVASGYDEVERAFESIAKKADRAAAAQRAHSRVATTGTKRAGRAAKEEFSGYTTQHRRTMANAKARQREVDKAANAEVRAAERKVARIERLENRLHSRIAKQRERDSIRQQRAQERIARARRGRGSAMLGGALRLGIGAVGAVGAVASGVGGAAMRQNLQLHDVATRIAIQGRGAGKAARDPQSLMRGFQSAATAAPGSDAMSIAQGVSAFVAKTGDLERALSLQETLATAMVATGASGEDLGAMLADLSKKFDIKSVDGMQKALATLIDQGKRGSFELADAAAQFPKIGAAAERFGGMRGAGGLAMVGGLTQIAREATPSGEEAGTAVESMFRQLAAKSDVLGRKGVNVFADKGKTQARDVRDILAETIGKYKGNVPELQKVFDVRGIRAVSPLIAEFNRVQATTGDVNKAMDAVRQKIDAAIGSTAQWSEVQRDASVAQQSSAVQLTTAWESIKKAVGDSATPAILSAVKKFAELEAETGILTKAGSAVGTAFAAIAEAAELAADALQALGILDPTDPAEKARKKAGRDRASAQQAIDDLNMAGSDQRKAGGIIGKGGKKSEQLQAAIAAGIDPKKFLAYRRESKKLGAANDVLFTEDLGPRSGAEARAAFVKRYMAAGASEGDANAMAQQIAKNPEKVAAHQEGLAGVLQSPIMKTVLAGMPLLGAAIDKTGPAGNEDQMAAVRDFAAEVTAAKGGVKDAALGDALKEAAAAAKEFAANAKAAKPQASVFVGE